MFSKSSLHFKDTRRILTLSISNSIASISSSTVRSILGLYEPGAMAKDDVDQSGEEMTDWRLTDCQSSGRVRVFSA